MPADFRRPTFFSFSHLSIFVRFFSERMTSINLKAKPWTAKKNCLEIDERFWKLFYITASELSNIFTLHFYSKVSILN